MKYLKRFNEELDPKTYMSAGKSLQSKGHVARGQKLIDYSNSNSKMSGIADEFEFTSSGKKYLAKWDYTKGVFETADGKRIYLKGTNLFCNSYPIRRGESHPHAYVTNRKDAVNLLKFLKTVITTQHPRALPVMPTINDLYQEDAPKSLAIPKDTNTVDNYYDSGSLNNKKVSKSNWFKRNIYPGSTKSGDDGADF